MSHKALSITPREGSEVTLNSTPAMWPGRVDGLVEPYQPLTSLPKNLLLNMQFLRVCTNRMLDQHARVMDVDWYEAGVLKIMDNGERVLSIYAMPGIPYRILDDSEKLPVIR